MASKLYDAYKTSKDAEANGVWVDEAGSSFKLARMGGANTRYQRALTAAMKPHMREMQLGMLDEAVADPIMRKVFIDTVLLDAKFTDEAGAVHEHSFDGEEGEVSFSKDAAEKLFADLPDLYTRLREQASSYSNYRASALKAASGN